MLAIDVTSVAWESDYNSLAQLDCSSKWQPNKIKYRMFTLHDLSINYISHVIQFQYCFAIVMPNTIVQLVWINKIVQSNFEQRQQRIPSDQELEKKCIFRFWLLRLEYIEQKFWQDFIWMQTNEYYLLAKLELEWELVRAHYYV